MINGLMHPVDRRAPWFGLLDFVNRLAVPSFLFISGFAFCLSSQRNCAGFGSGGALFPHTLGRIGLLWLLGSLLRLPYCSLHTWQQFASSEQVRQFFSVDILQSIACCP